jgi:hypothetical protein
MPNRPRNPEMLTALNQFIADHIEEIRLRTKGKNERLLRQFTEQTCYDIPLRTFTEIVKRYMRDHGIEWALMPNKYRKPRAPAA